MEADNPPYDRHRRVCSFSGEFSGLLPETSLLFPLPRVQMIFFVPVTGI